MRSSLPRCFQSNRAIISGLPRNQRTGILVPQLTPQHPKDHDNKSGLILLSMHTCTYTSRALQHNITAQRTPPVIGPICGSIKANSTCANAGASSTFTAAARFSVTLIPVADVASTQKREKSTGTSVAAILARDGHDINSIASCRTRQLRVITDIYRRTTSRIWSARTGTAHRREKADPEHCSPHSSLWPVAVSSEMRQDGRVAWESGGSGSLSSASWSSRQP